VDTVKIKTYVCTCGKSWSTAHDAKVTNFCSGCGEPLKEPYEKARQDYIDQMKSIREENAKLRKKFKEDVLKHCGFENHVNSEKILTFVEDHTSSSHEVVDMVEELSDIFN